MFEAIAAAGERLKDEAGGAGRGAVGRRRVVLRRPRPRRCSPSWPTPAPTGIGDPGRHDRRAASPTSASRSAGCGRSWPVPVIAAVHGHALGGGLQLALGADVRIVHPDTSMSVREVHWGLVPDMTGTLMLSLAHPSRRGQGADDDGPDLHRHRGADARSRHPPQRRPASRRDGPRQRASPGAAPTPCGRPRRCSTALVNLDAPASSSPPSARRSPVSSAAPNQIEAVMANVEGRRPDFTDPG